MTAVLVLNATYEPLSVVSIRRAIVLLLKEKAELLEAAEATLRATGLSMPVPLVIRMVYYVRIPKSSVLPLSRRTVMARDQYTCQYCGTAPLRADLTLITSYRAAEEAKASGRTLSWPVEGAIRRRATVRPERRRWRCCVSRTGHGMWRWPCWASPLTARSGANTFFSFHCSTAEVETAANKRARVPCEETK